jgi:putative aldouronate transport system substrate-binding protein
LITWPQQYNAAQVWAKSSNKKRLPPLSFLPDEVSRLANIMNRINTYYSEMFDKYVAGRVSNIDTLVNTIKKMGIDEAIKIYQQAYNRYLKR